MGKMGSCTAPFRSRNISQVTKPTNKRTANISDAITAPLPHANRVPASSRVNTNSIDAVNISAAPMISSLRNEVLEKRVRSRSRKLTFLSEVGGGRKKNMSAVAIDPAGALNYCQLCTCHSSERRDHFSKNTHLHVE